MFGVPKYEMSTQQGDHLDSSLSINFEESPGLHITNLELGIPSTSAPPRSPLPAVPVKPSTQNRSSTYISSNKAPVKPALTTRPTPQSQAAIPSPSSLKQSAIRVRGHTKPALPKREVRMVSPPKPTKAQMHCLEVCHKTTHSIDPVAVHILEYLTTTATPSAAFTQLSHDFLSTCEILYTLETGLKQLTSPPSSTESNLQQLPAELFGELETRFRVTQTDFHTLNQVLQKMNAPKRSLGRTFGKMFGDGEGEIRKITQALKRTRESLKMSSLVFQWSLDANGKMSTVERGFGYKGLAAALDRLDDRPEKKKGVPTPVAQAQNTPPESPPRVTSDFPAFPAPPPQTHANFPFGEIDTKNPPIEPQSHQSQVQSQAQHHSQAAWATRTPPASQEGSIGRAESHHQPLRRLQSFPSNSNSEFHHQNGHIATTLAAVDSFLHSDKLSASGDDTRSMTSHTNPSISQEDPATLDLDPQNIVKHTIEPGSMPRLYPPLSVEGESPSLKGALISAIRGKNHRLVEQLLQKGVSTAAAPNIHPLKEAIWAHDEESVRLLLLLGADPNEAGRDGMTPLLACVEKSFLAGATMLLKYGANPHMGAGYGDDFESPLAVAVMANMVGISQLLLQYNGDANHQTSDGTPLLTAAIKKKTPKKFIELLLAYGAKVNAKSRAGKVALFEALSVGRADITAVLLEGGADANLPGPKHMLWPAIHHPACLSVLLSHGADHQKAPGIMEQAVGINNIETVRILLKAGVNPNTMKDGTYTPLCSSIRDNRPELLKLLLSNGADPNVPAVEYPAFKCVTHSRVHFLPLLLEAGVDLSKPKGILETAVSSNNLEALNWLLDQGVSPNDRSPKGMSPLTTAIRENRMDLVEILLLRGADPHMRGQGKIFRIPGWNLNTAKMVKDWPIVMAVTNPPMLERLLTVIPEPQAFKGIVERAVHADSLESIKLLLAAGVSVEDKTGGVFSPLTTAIREDHREIVEYLLHTAGADVNAPGEHLPIVKALRTLRGEDRQVLQWLLEKGADPNRLYRGWNGIMQAVENGEADVLRLLAKNSGVDLEVRDDLGHTVVEMASSRGWDEAVQILIEGDLGLRMKA
ncbi:ankyrin repeat domain containing protein [Diplocarpon rosae]|nr:ankyrin repeat domain containing protein [Diplocarpon rosae]